MRFRVFGPIRIDLDEYGNIPNSMNSFWEEVDGLYDGLSGGRGCYIFCIKTSGGPRIYPWYIGKTNRQTFAGECFKPHQRNHYSRALNYYDRAHPGLFLVAQFTSGGKLYKGQGEASINFLETYLIGLGLRANHNLMNKRDTKLYRELVLPGFLNSDQGNPGLPANELRKVLGVNF
jgi:hypothetical protein